MRSFSLAVALAISVAVPALADPSAGIVPSQYDHPTGPPVQIESCLIQQAGDGATRVLGTVGLAYLATHVHNDADAIATVAGGAAFGSLTRPALVVKFTNESASTADIVRIRVTAPDGTSAYIRDVGSFASGTEVTHVFKDGTGLSGQSFFTTDGTQGDDCKVDFVRFTDGRVWSAPHYRRNSTTSSL